MTIRSINSQLTHVCRSTFKCTLAPTKNITKGFCGGNETKHEANEVFQSQKQVWRKDLIIVISNPLVIEKLEVVGHEFCWLDLTSVGRTLVNVPKGTVATEMG